MSARSLRKLRKQVNYETDVPRCGNCRHFNGKRVVLKDSLPVRFYCVCTKHSFEVRPNAVCDTWIGSTGDVLMEAANG